MADDEAPKEPLPKIEHVDTSDHSVDDLLSTDDTLVTPAKNESGNANDPTIGAQYDPGKGFTL
jgi:hypothetical protein